MFKAVGEALPKDQGLAVLTAFIKVGKENSAWNKLVALLTNVKCKVSLRHWIVVIIVKIILYFPTILYSVQG